MKLTDLPIIVREMRAELEGRPRAERAIDRTLIQLLRRNDTVQLVIGHPDHYVPLEDAEQIARAFGVAEATDPHIGLARIGSQDGHSIKVRATAYTWREAAPANGAGA